MPVPSGLSYVIFVSVDDMMKLILRTGVERFLTELAAYVEEDFRRWESFDKTARVASHSVDGVIELMPTSDGKLYTFKYVNGHPKNIRTGRQTVTAMGVLADVGTGYPTLLSEMTPLSALRTAATSAVAAKYLAPPGAGAMAIIGNGAQAEFQALAFKAMLGVNTLRLYDIDPVATRKCMFNLERFEFDITACASSAEAVQGTQIITTATADKQYATILTDNMVGAGVHINAIGGDCPGKTELHKDNLLRSDIFVEYTAQTRIEGEIQQLSKDHPVQELWQVTTGQVPGRGCSSQITLFDSVGFATEDFPALRYVRDHPFIRVPVWLYTFIFWGTPVYVQLLLIYSGIYGLQFVRHIPPLNEFFRQGFNCAVLAFALNTLAYTTEIFAGAIRDTAHGEVDAGLSLGMSRALLYRRIIIPAALRRALPAYSNEVILMLHATSLAFTATVPDILKVANDAYSATYDPFDSFGLAALIYLAVSFTLVACFRKAEWRLLAHLRT